MSELSFAPLNGSFATQIEAWAQQDANDALLKQSALPEFAGHNSGWVALDGSNPVAVAILALDQHSVGNLSIIVKPSERRRGIGSSFADYVLDQPEIRSTRVVRAVSGFDNTAAQKILTRRGFSQIGYSEDGRVQFERH